MGIAAVASVPQPPLLLPGRTGQPVAEVEQLRAACLAAIATVTAVNPDVLVLAGQTRPVEVGEPLAAQVGASLLASAGVTVPVRRVLLDSEASPAVCLAAGAEIADADERVGLLVLADGSACRTVKAPGYLDERAVSFDDRLTASLQAADADALAELDPVLAQELLVAGRVGWQVLAGALRRSRHAWTATTHYAGDPFGVWYPVLSYRPA